MGGVGNIFENISSQENALSHGENLGIFEIFTWCSKSLLIPSTVSLFETYSGFWTSNILEGVEIILNYLEMEKMNIFVSEKIYPILKVETVSIKTVNDLANIYMQ